jgi:hypothetical protein
MRWIATVALWLGLVASAAAQTFVGPLPAGNVVGNPTGATAPPAAFPIFSTANSWTANQTLTKLLEMTNSAPLGTVNLQTVVPVNGFYASGSGANFQNCPLIGCLAGDHQQSALYLKATAVLDASIAEYMATFDCNLNSGSTGVPVGPGGFSNAKVCVFNSATTGSSAGANTWGMANDLVIGAGDTGTFKVGAEFDFQNNSADCVVGVRNCINVYISGAPNNPITAFLQLASQGSVTNAHYGLLISSQRVANIADIEDSSGAAIGISIGGLIPQTHSTASFADASTSPIGIRLGGAYTTAIQITGTATTAMSIPTGQNFCLGGFSFCLTAFSGTIFTVSTINAAFLQSSTVQVIGSLPACAVGTTGVRTNVSNGVATPGLGTTVSATGAVWQPVVCNGTNWVYG